MNKVLNEKLANKLILSWTSMDMHTFGRFLLILVKFSNNRPHATDAVRTTSFMVISVRNHTTEAMHRKK